LLLILPSSTFAADFSNVIYHRCYDGDTCTFTLPGVHPLFGEKISVRIAGLDTP
jgi:endonuclease YncB( thermonuclease family)